MEDKLIVESFLRERTEESFSSLFGTFCGRVRRFFLLHGLDVSVAEDLSQEVFLKVYRKSSELRDAERFSGWIFAIARNVLIGHAALDSVQDEVCVLGIVGAMEAGLTQRNRGGDSLRKHSTS